MATTALDKQGTLPPRRDRRVRTCNTMDMHRQLARADAAYRARSRQSEFELRQWQTRYRSGGLRLAVVRIPVVVHVVWHMAVENISVAQIQSQIDVLNADFRMANADSNLVPDAFKPVRADTRIEFGLARRAPDCTATNGITRRQTAIDIFWQTLDSELDLKTTARGGTDPWPRDRYLNIWVCNYAALGYARYPSAPAHLDGVIITYEAFGSTGAVQAPFDLGRTATHEVAHWLNLMHLWGDDDDPGAACMRSDEVADTPTQLEENVGCPNFPHITCGNAPHGDMFMNFLDYADDACMHMFTAGQADRMNATLQTTRSSILSSDGLIPPPGGGGPDLWSRNSPDDVGAEPDPAPGPVCYSDDLWVRQGSDGLANDEHENAQYRSSGSPNFVYVRVRNRGCAGLAAQSGTLKVYWAKASPSLAWPAPWDGSITVPAIMGGPVGELGVSVNSGEERVYEFPWVPPNPANYDSFGAGRSHFCLLARIETAAVAPYGMTVPETSNLTANVRNNNNIAWKNISVMESAAGGARVGAFIVGDFGAGRSANMRFEVPKDEKHSIFEWGRVLLRMGERLHERWSRAGRNAIGMEIRADREIEVMRNGALLQRLSFTEREFDVLELRVLPKDKGDGGARVFALDAVQLDERDRIVGAQRFYVRTGPSPSQYQWDRALGLFDGVTWRRRDA